MISKYREKLEERLNEEFIKLQRKNDEVSEKTCKALLGKDLYINMKCIFRLFMFLCILINREIVWRY